MAKKSGGGGVGLVLIGGAIALLATVPKEVWITLAVVGAIGAVLYFIAKSKGTSQPATPPETWSRPAAPARQRSYKGAASAAAAARDPVSVYREPQVDAGSRVPAAPAGYGTATWVPPRAVSERWRRVHPRRHGVRRHLTADARRPRGPLPG